VGEARGGGGGEGERKGAREKTIVIEMNITGMLPPTGNLKASPSLFTHAKSALNQSIMT
jgi:hypothetical protein